MLGHPDDRQLTVFVRQMVADDIYRGFLETLEALAPVELYPMEALLTFKRRSRVEGLHTFVAISPEANRVVGTATLIIEPKFIHKAGLAGRIEEVAVHPDYQHKSVGGALLKEIISFANLRKCYKITLNCDQSVISFYRKFGFVLHDCGMRLDLGDVEWANVAVASLTA